MASNGGVIVAHTSDMEWQTGGDVIDLMAAEFRDNLGPTHKHYDQYYQKNLWLDPVTGRRTDLIKMEPGYADATVAYHDCVEECFALEGQCDLWGEGILEPGEYFWRPPGWVHGAGSKPGFVALLVLESLREADGSGPVSRVIRPDEDAGSNALHPDDSERAVGPRGFIKRADSKLHPWIPGQSFARGEGTLNGFDIEHTRFKILSKNLTSGAQTVLLELSPGYEQSFAGVHSSALQAFVLDGEVTLGDTKLVSGSYVHRPAGAHGGVMGTASGATLFVKIDGWLDFVRPHDEEGD